MNQDQGSLTSRWTAAATSPAHRLGVDPPDGRSVWRPHVCFVAMNIYPVLAGSQDIEFVGGAEVQQAVLAKTLHADGFRVSVLTADHGQGEVVDHDGVRIHRVP